MRHGGSLSNNLWKAVWLELGVCNELPGCSSRCEEVYAERSHI